MSGHTDQIRALSTLDLHRLINVWLNPKVDKHNAEIHEYVDELVRRIDALEAEHAEERAWRERLQDSELSEHKKRDAAEARVAELEAALNDQVEMADQAVGTIREVIRDEAIRRWNPDCTLTANWAKRAEKAEARLATTEEALRWIKREADDVVANAPGSPRRLPLALAIANKARAALAGIKEGLPDDPR